MSEAAAYPDKLAIEPVTRPPRATVAVPGSKSMTNRALVLAALHHPVRACVLHNVLHSEDTGVMIAALRQLGIPVTLYGDAVEVGTGEKDYLDGADIIPAHSADLFVANSGTTMRFLTAMVSLGR